MRYYAVLDTNVLVSALFARHSNPARILDEAAGGCIIPVYSCGRLEEYGDVLRRAKFPFSEQDVRALLEMILSRGLCLTPAEVETEMPDLDDVVFYAVVMEKRKEGEAYLVTGNLKHYPKEPFILTPREMLDLIESDAAGK